jgi:hypothetical protein
MTTQTQQTLHFPEIDRKRGWKDAFVVASLAIVLGAFVAQIASSPSPSRGSQPTASAASAGAWVAVLVRT